MSKKVRDYLIIVIELVLIVGIITVVVYSITNREKDYDYFKETGIDKLKGTEPLYVEEYDGYTYKYYEDACLVYYEVSGGFVRAEITGDKYEIEKGISVGTDREIVEKTFSNRKTIKDLPADEWGFIEDCVWIHFSFDEKNTVDKIRLYYDGP